jgi:glycosidase
MDKRVTQDDIIYFIVTDRFFGRNKRTVDTSDTTIHGGTLDGILEKLDDLIELGVTTIWVTPVYANIQNHGASEPYHYYWPLNFEQMDGRLLDGTRLPNSVDMSAFGKFVDLCQAKGMKVVLDTEVFAIGSHAQG